jgi:Mg2+ and Co2+ transporter CorA
MTSGLLGTDALHDDVQQEMREMSYYLDSDAQRRESNTMMRLTVVTTLGLIGTLVTGFFGMNLMSMGEDPLLTRIGVFAVGLIGCTALTLVAVVKSKRVADLLDALSDESISPSERREALRDVVRRSRRN